MAELTPEAQVIEAMFSITDKSGAKQKFVLNKAQRRYDSCRTRRDMIPKARQKGFSSLGIAYQTVDCLTKYGTRAVLISHEAKATQRLLDKARFYLQHLEGPAPELGRRSRNEFFFPKTESTYYIGTAGAKAFGRGDTINHLHISEYAWWESDALQQVAGLFQAVPLSGTIRIESTGKGRTNDFYYMCYNADSLGYKVNFQSWWDDPEYSLEVPGPWVPEGFEDYFQDMQTKYNLLEEQLYWYWYKLKEFRLDKRTMQQEYPSCFEECFQATGGAIFPDVTIVDMAEWTWKLDKDNYRVNYLKGHPRQDRTYIIGMDPSGGTGHDDAGMQITCLETLEQVLQFGRSDVDPVEFGRMGLTYGKKYNEAFIVCESNNHGIATHAILSKRYPRLKIYKRKLPTKSGIVKYGFPTTRNTKHELIGALKELIDLGLSIYDQRTIKQMLAYEEDPNTGEMWALEDDLVIALALSAVGCFKYMRYASVSPLIENKPVKQESYEGVNLMFTTYEEIFTKRSKPGPDRPWMH